MKTISNGRRAFEVMKRAETIRPFAVVNGEKMVSYEDAIILAEADMLDGDSDLGLRKFNPDGTLARTKSSYIATRRDILFNNRYREVSYGAVKRIQIVVDYRALKEQRRGVIYTKQVQAYEIGRDKKSQKLKLYKIVQVLDTEFVSEFTHKLCEDDMRKIIPLIDNSEIQEEKLNF